MQDESAKRIEDLQWQVDSLYELMCQIASDLESLKDQRRWDYSDILHRIDDVRLQNEQQIRRYEFLYPQGNNDDDND